MITDGEREGIAQSAESINYRHAADQVFSLAGFGQMVGFGDRLVKAEGGYIPAVRHIQDMSLSHLGDCAIHLCVGGSQTTPVGGR